MLNGKVIDVSWKGQAITVKWCPISLHHNNFEISGPECTMSLSGAKAISLTKVGLDPQPPDESSASQIGIRRHPAMSGKLAQDFYCIQGSEYLTWHCAHSDTYTAVRAFEICILACTHYSVENSEYSLNKHITQIVREKWCIAFWKWESVCFWDVGWVWHAAIWETIPLAFWTPTKCPVTASINCFGAAWWAKQESTEGWVGWHTMLLVGALQLSFWTKLTSCRLLDACNNWHAGTLRSTTLQSAATMEVSLPTTECWSHRKGVWCKPF